MVRPHTLTPLTHDPHHVLTPSHHSHTPSCPHTVLQEGERCDGETEDEADNEQDDEEDESKDSSKDSTGRRRGRGRARKRIAGANDRRIFGELGEATPPCGEGLVCMRVALDRRECRPENPVGETTPTDSVTTPLTPPLL